MLEQHSFMDWFVPSLILKVFYHGKQNRGGNDHSGAAHQGCKHPAAVSVLLGFRAHHLVLKKGRGGGK